MAGSPRAEGLWPRRLALLAVVVTTAAVFFPAVHFQFVNWDDDKFILANPHYRGLGLSHLRWMFTTFLSGPYQPLSWLSYAFDYMIWGMNPMGYHLANLLLHAANSALFYLVSASLFKLSAQEPPGTDRLDINIAAAFAALLFSIHPLRAESVAWVTERRDVLSGFFFLLTVLLYVRELEAPGQDAPRTHFGSVIAYALSLLSKGMGVSLPVILLTLDFYPLRRIGGDGGDGQATEILRVLREKIPFFVLAFSALALGVYGQAHSGIVELTHESPAERTAHVLYALGYYPWKTLFPFQLIPLHEVPMPDNPLAWPYVLSGAAVTVLSLLLIRARGAWPAGLAAWICYLATIAPVAGVVRFGPQIVAERYSYLSCLGFAALGGGALLWASRALSAVPRKILFLLSTTIIALLMLQTSRQVLVWRDSVSLWTHTLAVDPDNSLAHNNLAVVLKDQGRLNEAERHYREAIALKPDYADAHYNLAVILTDRRKLDEAMGHLWKSLFFNSNNTEAHILIGIILEHQGKLEEAAFHDREAIRLDPGNAQAYNNLGSLLLRQRKYEQAAELFRAALRINGEYRPAQDGLRLAAQHLRGKK